MKTYKIDPLGKNRPLMLVRGTRLPESFPDSVAEHMAKSLKANCRGVFTTINGEISRSTVSPGVVMSIEDNEDNNTLAVMTEDFQNEYVEWEDSTGKQFRLEHTGRFAGSQLGGHDLYYTGAHKDLRTFVTGAVPYTGQPLVADNAKQWYSYTTPEGVSLTFRGCIQAPVKGGTDFVGLKIDSINFLSSDTSPSFELTLDCDSAISLGLSNGMNDDSKPFNMSTGIGWLQIVATDDFKSHINGFIESTGDGDADIDPYEAYDGFTYNVDLAALSTQPGSSVYAANVLSFRIHVKSGSALENSIIANASGFACESLGVDMSGSDNIFPMVEEVSTALNAEPTVVNLTPDNDKSIVVIRFSNVQEGEQLHLDLGDTVTVSGVIDFRSMNTSLLGTVFIGTGEKSFVIDIPSGDDVFAFFNVDYSDAGTLTISRTKGQQEPVRTPGFYNSEGQLVKAMTKEEVEQDYQFEDCPSETTKTIRNATNFVWPEGVTSIGHCAFSFCSGLTSVTIPEGVTSIGDEAFSFCSGLTSLTIPEGVTSIGNNAFSDCSALASVIIPNTVATIGDSAFYGCSALNPLTVPNTVATIGDSAFYQVQKVIYGGTATGTPWGALQVVAPPPTPGFYSANGQLIKAMTKDEIEKNYEGSNYPSISNEAVATSTEFLWPEGVTKVGYNVFKDCTGLTGVTIPSTVTEIGFGAFAGCTDLTSVTIQEGVRFIGSAAFSGCASLATAAIPSTVGEIDNYAFENCSSLTEVVIPNSMTEIANGTFYGCSALASVIIPNTVTSIIGSAFNGCTSINPLTVPNTVTTIGTDAFKNVPRVIYGGTASGSPWGALEVVAPPPTPGFYSADNQLIKAMTKEEVEQDHTSANMPSWVNSAVKNATKFVWPEGVTKVGAYVFSNCFDLAEITIPDGVTSIGAKAFEQCQELTSVTLPNTVTSIGEYAFSGCKLTSVTIPEGVTSIGSYAFAYGNEFNTLIVPNTVTTIGENAFRNVPKVIYNGSASGSPWGATEVAAS